MHNSIHNLFSTISARHFLLNSAAPDIEYIGSRNVRRKSRGDKMYHHDHHLRLSH